jgi:hypothetical protein
MEFDWSKPFSFDIAKQYSPTSSGGAPMFDPASMAFAGLGAVGNAAGALFSGNAASQQVRQRAISDAMALRYKESGMFGEAGNAIANRIYGATIGDPLSENLQRGAKRFEYDFLEPKQQAFDTESARRQLNTRNSTAFKDAARFTADLENRAQMIRNMGAGINMFGQTGQTARFTA